MTYQICKRVIENKLFRQERFIDEIGCILLNNRISQNQYNELVGLLSTLGY